MKKLGIAPGMKLLLINEPANYFSLLAEGTGIAEEVLKAQQVKKGNQAALVHLFVVSVKEMEQAMKKLAPLYQANPSLIIWVSWYKKSAKIPTDVTEDTIRNYALANGLVDVKVCAVSEAWSALKLVVPLAKR